MARRHNAPRIVTWLLGAAWLVACMAGCKTSTVTQLAPSKQVLTLRVGSAVADTSSPANPVLTNAGKSSFRVGETMAFAIVVAHGDSNGNEVSLDLFDSETQKHWANIMRGTVDYGHSVGWTFVGNYIFGEASGGHDFILRLTVGVKAKQAHISVNSSRSAAAPAQKPQQGMVLAAADGSGFARRDNGKFGGNETIVVTISMAAYGGHRARCTLRDAYGALVAAPSDLSEGKAIGRSDDATDYSVLWRISIVDLRRLIEGRSGKKMTGQKRFLLELFVDGEEIPRETRNVLIDFRD